MVGQIQWLTCSPLRNLQVPGGFPHALDEIVSGQNEPLSPVRAEDAFGSGVGKRAVACTSSPGPQPR